MTWFRSIAALSALIALLGCHGPAFNLPPADRLMAPGPGVDGPGPGVLSAADLSGMQQSMADLLSIGPDLGPMPTVQVLLANPAGMYVYWDNSGSGGFEGPPVVVPGRTNFDQAGLDRAKLTNIPGHEGVELYPTVEVGRPTPRTLAFISHNTIPVQLTPEDLNQVTSGNFVTKVIYLPDPEFQHLAVAGVETLVSTRLDPGIDPVQEADRRGAILAIVRIGNKDIEMPGTSFNECFSETLTEEGEVAQASYTEPLGGRACRGRRRPLAGRLMGPGRMDTSDASYAWDPSAGPAPAMVAAGIGPGPVMPGYGPVGAPVYGMPITGTPIGLPGPPHIPLGGPAGLKKHVITNHTHTYIPEPNHDVRIHVKHHPSVSYPAPRNRAWIHQYNHPTCAHCVGSGTP